MLLLLSVARAASLDNLEIGGPWGTPTATDATAVWWNPAGVAAGRGTRIELEGAPEFATILYERTGEHPGTDTLQLTGVIPFAGIATDFGVEGLGVGVALSVPIARGGTETQPPGAGAYHLMDGMNQAIYAQLAAGYSWQGKIAVGGSAALVRSQWSATVLTDTLPDLDAAIEAQGEESGYTDDMLESADYAATLEFEPLTDTAVAFSVGIRAQPSDNFAFGVAYVSGAHVDNEGSLTIKFGCPPETDVLGRFGAEQFGVCYAEVPANATVGYTLPGRVHGGVVFWPVEAVRVEAMGGWVGWSVFDDYEIDIHDAQAATEAGSELVNQERTWARANTDSAWGGIDVKGEIADDRVVLGARALYDQSAIPDEALSTNNYDANTLMLSGLLAWRPVKALELGASFTHHLLATREVTTSGFGMTVEGERADDRWYYPSANGTYSGSINRIGVQVRAGF